MTEHDIARNAAAIRNLAEKLERWGLSDPHQRAEHIAMNLLADGYARIDPIPALRPDTIADPDGPGRREFDQARAQLANRRKGDR